MVRARSIGATHVRVGNSAPCAEFAPQPREATLSYHPPMPAYEDAEMSRERWLFPVWRELDALKDRVARQMAKSQRQVEQLLDAMVEPLERRVAAIASQQPGIDAQLVELGGGVQGLHRALEVHSVRADAAESRFRRWRKLLEEELQAKHLELRRDIMEMVGQRTGERPDLRSEVAGILRRDPVEERHAIADAADSLRRELRLLTEAHGGAQGLREMRAALHRHDEALRELSDRVAVGQGALDGQGVEVPGHASELGLRSPGRDVVEKLRRDVDLLWAAVSDLADLVRHAPGRCSEACLVPMAGNDVGKLLSFGQGDCVGESDVAVPSDGSPCGPEVFPLTPGADARRIRKAACVAFGTGHSAYEDCLTLINEECSPSPDSVKTSAKEPDGQT
eukprot:CAMPEP_0176245128 /NCGR_PEP_ID=MMETSP0121_2-20121125/31784_1 /TAXON_ID=160619 /ORGANISM="Kryptoperidinium foliaceum, Strain CCMP 1326" /LENGTH=392 /DNA_ID=CAMNT_0017584751 /DNA_START=52 /DNA_END=1230 /DNA_ORIENTATION=-